MKGCGPTEPVSATPAAVSHNHQPSVPCCDAGHTSSPSSPAAQVAAHCPPSSQHPRTPTAPTCHGGLGQLAHDGEARLQRGQPAGRQPRRAGHKAQEPARQRAGWMRVSTRFSPSILSMRKSSRATALRPVQAASVPRPPTSTSASPNATHNSHNQHQHQLSTTSPHRTAPALLHGVQLRQHLQQEAHRGGLQAGTQGRGSKGLKCHGNSVQTAPAGDCSCMHGLGQQGGRCSTGRKARGCVPPPSPHPLQPTGQHAMLKIKLQCYTDGSMPWQKVQCPTQFNPAAPTCAV